jgi:hypothetical protein
MTSPAPQPAPLRPGQRAALALLDKPGAYAFTYGVHAFVTHGGKCESIDIGALAKFELVQFVESDGKRPRYRITPAGRAALRPGSREGGRGRRR